MSVFRSFAAAGAVGALITLSFVAGCGGGGTEKSAASGSTTSAAPPSSAAAPGAAAGALTAPSPGAPPQGATVAMVAEGDSIFHGLKAGGLCQTCHGVDASGGPLAPALTSGKWLTGDGNYEFIQQRITTGMPNPTPPYTGPMLPKGGANLTPAEIKAVAAYVYSISRSKSR